MSDHSKLSKAVRRLRQVKEAVETGEVDCPWKRIEQERSLHSAEMKTKLATENALQLGERLLAGDAINNNNKTVSAAAAAPAAAPPAASLPEDEDEDEIPTREATYEAIAAGNKSIRDCQEAIAASRPDIAATDRAICAGEEAMRRVIGNIENSESIFVFFLF